MPAQQWHLPDQLQQAWELGALSLLQASQLEDLFLSSPSGQWLEFPPHLAQHLQRLSLLEPSANQIPL
jgi:hypothetical protein